jgi:hypothetical protein
VAVIVVPAATGGTGVGAVFNLGRTNSVSQTSTLTGSSSSRMLQVTNSSSSGAALQLTTKTSAPPMKVNSSVKVANLNADKLDGLTSSDFMAAGAKPDAATLDGLDSTAFMPSSGTIAISANRSAWLVTNNAAPITADYSDVAQSRFTRTISGYNYLRIGVDMPVVLLGQELALTAVDFCYGASASAILSDLWVYRSTAVTGPGTTSQALIDTTDRTDAACRTYVPPAPVTLSAADALTLRIGVSWVESVPFSAGRVTFYVDPTGNAAPQAAALPVVQLKETTNAGPEED